MRPRSEPTSVPAAAAQTSEAAGRDEAEGDAESDAPTSPDVRPQARPAAEPPSNPDPQRPAAGYLSLFGAPALQKRPPRPDAPAKQDDAQALFDGSNALAVQQEAPAEPATDPLLDRVVAAWGRCVGAVKRERIHVGALLQHAKPDGVQGDTLLLAVPDDFHRRFLQVEQACLLEHLERALGQSIGSIRFVIQETLPADEAGVAEVFDAKAYMERKRKENPVVRAIFEQFGGELVW